MAHDICGTLVPARVTQLLDDVTTEWIKLSNGTTVTPGHRYLQPDGSFEEIGKMLEGGGDECEVVLADGSLQKVTGERIVYSEETAHLYEQAEKVVYETAGGVALQPKIVKGWKTYNFTVEKYHTYIADGVRVHNDSILSRVEPNDRLVSVSGDLDDAAIIRNGTLTILDGFDFGETTDTFVNITHDFMPNPGINIEQAIADLIASDPSLAGFPIDNPGPDNDLYDALVARGYGTWQTNFLGVPVPSLQGLIDIASGALFSFPPQSPLDALKDALTPLAAALTGAVTVDLEYSPADGDVTLNPVPQDASDLLLQALKLDAAASIAPGIDLSNVISALNLAPVGAANIKFGAGVAPDDVDIFRDGDDLLFIVDIGDGTTTSTATISDYFASGNAITVTQLTYADGSTGTLPATVPPLPSPPASNIYARADGNTTFTAADFQQVDTLEFADLRISDIHFSETASGALRLDWDLLERYAGLGIEDTVAEFYRDFLDREPDTAGLNYWVGQAQTNGLAFVLSNFTENPVGNVEIAGGGSYIDRFTFEDGTAVSSIMPFFGANLHRFVGTPDDDIFNGTSITDQIYAGDGDDVLDAGGSSGGLQYLYGQGGNDTYRFGTDNGSVYITTETATSGTADRVVFKDLSLTDLTLASYTSSAPSEGDILRFSWSENGQSGSLHISQMGQYIESFEFADGTVLSSIMPFFGANLHRFVGTSNGDTFVGTSITDQIYAGDGDDDLDAGGSSGGLQYLYGQGGNDTYRYGTDNGSVYITTETATSGTADRVVFKDLSLTDLTLASYTSSAPSEGDILRFSWSENGQSGSLHISQMGQHIESFVFADGTTVSSVEPFFGANLHRFVGTSNGDTFVGTSITDQMYAGDGDDDLDAGGSSGGLQYLYGQGGNDTYRYGTDNGSVYITTETASSGEADRVVFKDLIRSELTVATYTSSAPSEGDILRLSWNKNGQSGSLHISQLGKYIESFQFADGTSTTDFFGTTVIGTSAGETINGTEWGDVLSGSGGNDTVNGLGGDDTIYGGIGPNDDVLDGGAGNDTIYGNGGNNTLIGGPGDDYIDASGPGSTAVYVGPRENYTVVANADGSYTVFSVAEGTDTLLNVSTVQFSNGSFAIADLVDAPNVSTPIVGTDNAETMIGDAGDDTIVGWGGDDTIEGRAGDDILDGGTGRDILKGEDGSDLLRGRSGDDDLFGGAGEDELDGGDGADNLFGNDGDDVLQGRAGEDNLFGNDGNDVLRGGAGHDDLFGNAGDDNLEGGGGLDNLYGNTGADTFVYVTGDVKIFDFRPDSENDVIAIDRSDINTWSQLQPLINTSSNTYLDTIDFGNGDFLSFNGKDILELIESDFVFL